MSFNLRVLYVFLLVGLIHNAQAAFYDCDAEIGELNSDSQALDKIKQANNDRFKFSSQCLEILLKKNFFETSEFLINEYYPKTSIDTEVIVRNVAEDLKKNQNYLVFQIKRRELSDKFPVVKPVIYWAQNTEDILLMIKLHEQLDTPECKQSFELDTKIEEDWFSLRAYCYEGENSIRIFDTGKVQLKKKIVKDKSKVERRGDGKILINLRKENAPSFWKYLLQDAKREVKELQTWWEMRDRYIEDLEEYMMEENAKERAEKKAAQNEDL